MLRRIFYPSEHKLAPTEIKLPQAFQAKLENERIFIKAPSILCIDEPRYSYISYQFFDYLEKVIFDYKISISIDLSDLEEITTAASLLLFAKITKCQICVTKPTAVEIKQPESKEIKNILSSSGLWSGIKPGGLSKVRKLIDTNNAYMSGSNAQIENCPKVLMATLLCLVKQGVNFNTKAVHNFTRGVQEAILNVGYHAYGKESLARQYEELGDSRWWQCSWLDEDKNQLVFVIYDDGDGITNTLKHKYPELSDCELIRKAMTTGISRTNDPSRGKGSENIIQTSCNFPGSHLVVMSGNAYYTHNKDGEDVNPLPFTLKGTIVQWFLRYSEEDLK